MSVPARVLFAYRDDIDTRGGAAAVMERTADALRDLGVEVDVTYEVHPDPSGYDLVHAWNIWDPTTALEQLEHLRAAGATIVWQPFHLDWTEFAWARLAIPAVLGAPVTEPERERLLEQLARGEVQIAGMAQHLPNEPVPGFHAMLARMAELVDHACVCSLREVQTLTRRARPARLRWTLVPHGIDPSGVAGATPDAFAERFGVRDHVLCVGALDARKNQALLVEALRGTGIPLVLAGPALEPEYRDLCLARGGDGVVHTGRIDRALVGSALAGAKVHALPSFAEGAALASMEAALAGVPVVVGDRTSEFEYFGDLATFCDPADVASIRAAVLGAIGRADADAARRDELRERIAGHTWERSARATLEAYAHARASRRAADRAALGLAADRDEVVVAAVDEVLAAPALLTAFAREHAADATLLLHGDDLAGARALALEAAVREAGLDGDDAEVVAVPGLSPADLARLDVRPISV